MASAVARRRAASGARDHRRSPTATRRERSVARRRRSPPRSDAGAAVYVIGDRERAVHARAARASSRAQQAAPTTVRPRRAALRGVYASIAEELKRTWRSQYVTAARPGDAAPRSTAAVGAERRPRVRAAGSATADTAAPTSVAPVDAAPGRCGAGVLAARGRVARARRRASRGLGSARAAASRPSIAPHTGESSAATKLKRRARAARRARGDSSASTERTFAHLKHWLERASHARARRRSAADGGVRSTSWPSAALVAGCSSRPCSARRSSCSSACSRRRRRSRSAGSGSSAQAAPAGLRGRSSRIS